MPRPASHPVFADAARADILPPGFDPALIAAFFSGRSQDVDADVPANSATGLTTPNAAATEALANADERAVADLARLLDLPNHEDDTIDTGTDLQDNPPDDVDGAGAKPDFAGSGNTKDGGSGGGKGGGKGKNAPAEETPTEPVAEDPVTTDPAPAPEEDTTATDPTGGTEPDPAPPTGPETNTGSTDPNVYVSGLDTPEGFNIQINWIGSWTDALKQDVIWAAEKISDIVTGDIASHNGIDDINISASITSVDGTGGAWAWGGYSSLRSDSFLPSEGYIRFDTADLSKMESYDLVDDFAFHEMLHAMGFGTAWKTMGLVEDFDGDLRFTGDQATTTYNDLYAMLSADDPLAAYGVPVETDGGSGTAGVHWDHDTFGQEIMTGTLAMNNVISDLTIAALDDMGYETIHGQDDFLFV